MSNIVNFWTPTAIPLDAFTIMSATAKFGTNPIGRFGTGLKYAIAIILRHGGTIRLFIDGVEYEFYLYEKNFRGKELSTVRMRKRHGLGHWLGSKQLPFTTHLGFSWELWMAYRELHSNTVDENGITTFDGEHGYHGKGTLIQVDCPGFIKAIDEAEAFLATEGLKKLHDAPLVSIYDAPSKYLYFDGIRVYTLRYPARLTYNLHAPYVQLTEDRTVGNLWSVLYDLSTMLMKDVTDRGLLARILNVSNDKSNESTFESMELAFQSYNEASPVFRSVATSLGHSGTASRSAYSWYATAKQDEEPEAESTEIDLLNAEWELIIESIERSSADAFFTEEQCQQFDEIVKKIRAVL